MDTGDGEAGAIAIEEIIMTPYDVLVDSFMKTGLSKKVAIKAANELVELLDEEDFNQAVSNYITGDNHE